MAEKKRKPGNDEAQAAERRRDRGRASDVRQRDLASDIQGRNSLQGNDQEAVRNQRREQPKVGGATGRPAPDDGEESGD